MGHIPKTADGWIINDSEETFSTWISRGFLSDDLRKQLLEADILIVPIEGFGNLTVPVFPVKTEELFHFLKKNLPQDLEVDICIEDNDYKELALHSDLIILAGFVVTQVNLPVLINLVSSYIYQKISQSKSKNIKTSILVNEAGKSKEISYEGPADDFGKILKEAKYILED